MSEIIGKGIGPSGSSISLPMKVNFSDQPNEMIAKLAARTLLRDFEDVKSPSPKDEDASVSAQILRIGLKYKLVTSQTSLVMVSFGCIILSNLRLIKIQIKC